MNFYCNGCEITKDFSECRIWIAPVKGSMQRFCKECKSGSATVYDVYFDGKPEVNLADDPITGKPRTFSGRAEKAYYLKQRGISEAGDRVHGAPIQAHQNQNIKVDRNGDVRKALRQVKEMGQDVRRQAYLKAIKEGEKARHA